MKADKQRAPNNRTLILSADDRLTYRSKLVSLPRPISDLENIHHTPTEDEIAVATRVNEAVYRFGNV